MTMTAGITRANEGLDGIVWNILGQTYVPKQLTEHSFSWHATFPPGTFVPPHIHPTQDEFIYMLEGRLDLVLDGQDIVADRRRPHPPADGHSARHLQQVGRDGEVPVLGLADAASSTTCSGRIHNMRSRRPTEVVALSAKHEVDFLPPPA